MASQEIQSSIRIYVVVSSWAKAWRSLLVMFVVYDFRGEKEDEDTV